MKKYEVDRRISQANEKEKAGVLGRVGSTALEVLLGAPLKGAVKSLEGIYDAGAGLVGAVGGAFDKDFRENVGSHIAFDATGWLTDSIGYDKVEESSYLNDGKVGNFVRDVEQGIGGMLPSVALSAIPYAGAVLGPVSMGMAAGGNNMESALENGTGYYGAWLYGMGTGAIEGATEMIGGFALGKSSTLVSKALSGTKLGKIASSSIGGKVAETFISEAGEEMLSDVADPALKYVTGVDKNIGKNYKETIKGLPRTALLGGTIGTLMSGGSAAVAGVRNSSRGGFKANSADNAMEYIGEVSKYYDKDVSKHAKYDKAIDGALYDISKTLTSMSKEQRTNYMSTMGLYKNAFNEDGSIKSDLRADINTGAVSSNLRAISATLKHKPLSADTELTDGASKAKSYVEKMLGEGANVVVTSDSAQNNAFYNVDEGIVYINNNAAFSGEEIAEFVATHEVAHITEGTRAYGEMALMLEEIAKDPKAPAALKAKIGDIKARKKQIRDAYAGQMQGMNIAQREFLVETELNADLVGILLGDEYFIEKLAQRDASLVEKIFNKLKALAKRDTSSTTSGPPSPQGEGYKKSASVDRESAKYLSKLVNKFGRAINKSQGGVKISQLGREDEEKGAEVENEETGIRFSKSKNEYPYQMQKVIEGYLEAVDESILNQAETQRKNKNAPFKRLEICKVDSDFAEEMAELYKMDLTGFSVNINSNAFNHIEKRHGLNGEADKSMANLKDVARLRFVIQNRDSIEPLTYKDEQVYSKEFSANDGTPAPLVLIKKKINGTYYCAIAVTDGKYSKVWVQTAFINKRDGLTQILHDEISSLSYTSETVPASHPSNDSISENGEKINTFDKKIDDERKSISKSERFTQAQYTQMSLAEELVKGYEEGTLSSEDALRKLNAFGYKTGINTDNALERLEELIPEIREYATSGREAYRESNRKDTADFIESVSKMNDKSQLSKRKKKIGTLSREHAEIVTNLMKNELPGFSADGYELWMDGTGAKHIEDRHGVNGSADNSMATTEAKELISWAAQNAEKGYFIKENNGEIKRSKRFFNSDGSRAPEIRLEKQIDGDTVCVSECVPDSSNRRIWITSAYIKKGSKGQLLNMDENSSPQPTPEASFDSTATNTIIDENSQKSNSEQKKTKLTSKKAIKSLVLDAVDAFSILTENGEDVVLLPKEVETDVISAIWKKVNAKGLYNMRNFSNRVARQMMQSIVLGDGSIYKVNGKLKSIMHKIDLTEFEEHITSKNKLKYFSRWQLKEGYETLSIENAVAELNNLGFQISSIDKLQMLEEINSIYEETKRYIDEKDGKNIVDIMGEEEYTSMQNKIADKILKTLENAEKQTEGELHNILSSLIIDNTKMLEKYRNYRKNFKQDEKRLRKELNFIHQIEEINSIRKHTYTPAQQPRANEFQDIQKLLAKTVHNGNINLSSFREAIGAISPWYTKDNELLGEGYSEEMADIIKYFKDAENVEREPSINELDYMNALAAHFKNVFKNFGKIYRAGHWVELTEIAIKDFNSKSEAIDSNTPLQKMCQMAEYITTPLANATMWDGHDPDGELTRYVKDCQKGELELARACMEVEKAVFNLMKKNKKLFDDVLSGKYKIKCGMKVDLRSQETEVVEIPVNHLVCLYATARSMGDSDFSLEESGYALKHDNSAKTTYMNSITPEEIKKAYETLPEPIKELAEWMINWNNTVGKQVKIKADLRKKGFANVIEGDYWNGIREHYEGTNDMQRRFGTQGIGVHGFTNERVKGAKARLVIDGFIQHFIGHVRELYTYAILDPIKTDFDKVMQVNVNISENATGGHKSIKTLINEQSFFHYGKSKTALDYFEKLTDDVFGIKPRGSLFNEIIGWLRGGYATYALGANLKVLPTQFSSLIAGFGELNATSVLYGGANILNVFNPSALKKLANDVDKYCSWAKVRHYEKGATKAMSLTDKVGKVREWFTKLIEIFDRFIVMLEFKACQKEVESRYHIPMGTEENKIKAGELLTEVGLKTQQNQYASTKSAIARSDNEIAKSFAMFKNDATAVTSGLVQQLTAWSVLNKKIKLAKDAGDTASVTELEKLRNQARRKVGKYTTVVILSCAYMTLLARLFNKLYHQDEDDEMAVGDILLDVFGNFLGMFPIVSEISAFFLDGYDVDNSVYSSMNNALEAIGGTVDLVKNAIGGKNVTSEEIASTLRKDIYALGQIFGVPARNIYKNTKAVIDLVSPSTGDKIDAWFKAPSEKSLEENIKASIEKGNDKAVSSSLGLLYDKYDLKLEDAVLRREYERLMRLEMTKAEDDSAKYSPLEAKIPSNLSVDGEEVELLKKDINTFKNAFLVAEKSQASVVKTAPYKKLKDEERAYALRKISQFYYEETKYSYTGEKSNFTYYAKVVGIEDLALILAYAKNLKGDARQSRREKIEAYIKGLGLNAVKTSLALRCLGYSDKDNDELVKGYIGRASVLSKEERAELLKVLE